MLTIEELYSVQTDKNRLKSLHMELKDLENANPYHKNTISDAPKGKGTRTGFDFSEWYVTRKEKITKDIEYYEEKLLQDREMIDTYIAGIPHPDCDIIRYRAINGLGWYEIGDLLAMDRRTASRRFYNYVNVQECAEVI